MGMAHANDGFVAVQQKLIFSSGRWCLEPSFRDQQLSGLLCV